VKRPRWHLHFTPTSASWLNLVEGWLALLARRQLQRGMFTGPAALEAAIHAYIAQTNAEPKPFVWTKTADAILANIGRFCQRTSNSDHSYVRVQGFWARLPTSGLCRSVRSDGIQRHGMGDGALRRRLIKLLCAGWRPHSVFRLGAVPV
jgi:hypothetical protein